MAERRDVAKRRRVAERRCRKTGLLAADDKGRQVV